MEIIHPPLSKECDATCYLACSLGHWEKWPFSSYTSLARHVFLLPHGLVGLCMHSFLDRALNLVSGSIRERLKVLVLIYKA